MATALTVTQFVELINATLDALPDITVEGEIEGYKVIQGKWVVFDLKDKDSLVKCFMTMWNLRTQIEDGMVVRATGQAKLRNKGFFSFVVDRVEPAGEGALKRAFELLKQKLATEGLFATERKRTLPRFPQHVALITSRDAAAYSDFLKVLAARLGGLRISFIHTAVQGEEAPTQLIEALATANTALEALDAIVMVRGGGSMEDLQAFNDEQVIRAVASSRTPIIVGVGHERDVSLAELAADIRASTPSNAAELLVRSREELFSMLNQLQTTLSHQVITTLRKNHDSIRHSITVLRNQITTTKDNVYRTITALDHQHRHWRQRIQQYAHTLEDQKKAMHQYIVGNVSHKKQTMTNMVRLLHSFSPTTILKRGFSITRTAQGAIIKNPKDIKPGQVLVTQLGEGEVISKVSGDTAPQLELGL